MSRLYREFVAILSHIRKWAAFMANEMVEFILKLVERTPMPESTNVTGIARAAYEQARDVQSMYRGHPEILIDALKAYWATGAQAYVYAGIASVLAAASFVQGYEYEEYGLNRALEFLRKAQELGRERPEIEVVEAEIHIAAQRFPRARFILDQLARHSEFYAAIAEVRYWEHHDITKATTSFKKAMELAENETRQLWALNTVARVYLRRRINAEALKAFEQIVKIDPGDPWAWHNMSIIHLESKNFSKAEDCNRRALQLMDFEAARRVRTSIRDSKNLWQRIASWFRG
jgi:tetratricopeptide (TPR) repeat protein